MEKSAAVLTIYDAQLMTERGKKEIAAWLRRQANFLMKHNKELDKRFRARYLYT